MGAYNYVLSMSVTEEKLDEPWQRSISEFDILECGKTLPYSRKAPSRGIIQRGFRNDRNPNALTYEDVHQQWTQSCEEQTRVAAWQLMWADYHS